jgi:hypothetical protein
LGQFVGEEPAILEDVDLEDRGQLLIPMANFNNPNSNKHQNLVGGPGTTHLVSDF